MKKKEAIASSKPFAYYSGLGGVELYCIEYGINDYIYFTTNAWYGSPRNIPHKAIIHYEKEVPYFNCNGYKIPFDECIRI